MGWRIWALRGSGVRVSVSVWRGEGAREAQGARASLARLTSMTFLVRKISSFSSSSSSAEAHAGVWIASRRRGSAPRGRGEARTELNVLFGVGKARDDDIIQGVDAAVGDLDRLVERDERRLQRRLQLRARVGAWREESKWRILHPVTPVSKRLGRPPVTRAVHAALVQRRRRHGARVE